MVFKSVAIYSKIYIREQNVNLSDEFDAFWSMLMLKSWVNRLFS